LGYPDRALQKEREGLRVAQEQAHYWSLAFALFHGSRFLYDFCQDWNALHERAKALLGLCSEKELGGWQPLAEFIHGLALIKTGQVAAGLTQLHAGLAAWRATGAENGLPHMLRCVGEVHREMHHNEQGLAVVTEALTFAAKNEARFDEAELYRLKGELILQASEQSSEAEVCFHKAIEVARQQHAKSWELRAATSLARLWQLQGKKTEARDLLAPVCDWFTEGFDTPDLQAAKALLAEVA
jgi:predicted ATPase